jgi:hypothetical protein
MAEQGSGAPTAPISWRSIVYGTPVVGPDGRRIGTVREVLGSDADDIFHGLRVRPDNTKRDVLIEADDVASMAATGIDVLVDRAVVAARADFDEPATYHLSSVGWLRHHLGWKDDATSDEEPG